MNGQGGEMRLYAATIAVFTAISLIGVSGGKVFADTTTKAGVTPAEKYITVQEGDSLSSIAASNSTTYVRIYDANSQIQNPNLIYPGEVLMIPSSNAVLPQRALPSQKPVAVSSTVSSDEDVSSAVQAPAVQQTSTQSSPVNVAATSNNSVWDKIANCESGGNWSINTGNGFYGGLQFTLSSWRSVGGAGYPNQASKNEQILRAEMLQAQQGWGAWPVCSAKLGL